MTLYLLYWNNGLEFDDHEEVLLGAYLSPQDRDAAKARYDATTKQYWPFTQGEYVEWEIVAGEDQVAVFPGHESRQTDEED
jgi:hypothetical protein